MTVTVRSADPAEAPALVPLYVWLFAAPGTTPADWEPATAGRRLAEAAGCERCAVLVAVAEDDVVVGFCTAYLDIVSVRFGPRCWVEDLAVSPRHRSRGIGALLLEAAMSWAGERGAAHLELDSTLSRVDAHRFYEREAPDSRSLCFGWQLPRAAVERAEHR